MLAFAVSFGATLILFVLSIFLVVENPQSSKERMKSTLSGVLLFSSVVCFVLFSALLLTLLFNYMCRSAKLELHRNEYEVLLARVESGYCSHSNCLVDDVVEFNEGYERHKELEDSIWVSFLMFDTYNGIEPIECDERNHTCRYPCEFSK